VAGEVSTGRVALDEVLLGEERMGTCVIACREVNLGEPESVVVIICGTIISFSCAFLTKKKHRKQCMGKRTGQGEQLVADENGRLVLGFVEGVLPPLPQELLHTRPLLFLTTICGVQLYEIEKGF
jgi:hypothetical protein